MPPYLELSRSMTDFFGSAFSEAVPKTRVHAPPVRDFDDDGVTDDKDRAPKRSDDALSPFSFEPLQTSSVGRERNAVNGAGEGI